MSAPTAVAESRDDTCCHNSPAPAAGGGAEVSASRSDIDRRIDALEAELGVLQGRIAELRRQRAPEPVSDYVFTGWDNRPVHLSELFDGRRDLILVHNMGVGCNYCTLWADGFIGLAPHLSNRAAFVVSSPDPVDVQKSFAQTRGWTFPMVSAHGTSFFHDMGFTDGHGDPMPGVSVFRGGTDGRIMRVQRAEFGPGDQFCAAWHFFDMLADGVDGWEPRSRY
jgi:predicted dithiol-disulfide oxidoreductase (DUF899 family)